MRITVTGASSFIGSSVVRMLLKRGHGVCALRHSTDTDGYCMPSDFSSLAPYSSDIWIHFAWAGRGSAGRSDEDIQKRNVDMTVRALAAAERGACRRFLFAGSQAEYGAKSAYGRAKLKVLGEAKKLLSEKNSGMEYVHMRIFSAYGPGDHRGSLMDTVIRNTLSGADTKLGPCTQLWDYTYIDDVARAVVLLAESEDDVSGPVDVSAGDVRPLKSFVAEAESIALRFMPEGHAVSPGSGLIFGARENNAEGGADLRPDTERLSSLGFKAEVPFFEGIEKTVKYILGEAYEHKF